MNGKLFILFSFVIAAAVAAPSSPVVQLLRGHPQLVSAQPQVLPVQPIEGEVPQAVELPAQAPVSLGQYRYDFPIYQNGPHSVYGVVKGPPNYYGGLSYTYRW